MNLVEEIFNRVMDAPAEMRERVLEEATREDAALRLRVRSLVESLGDSVDDGGFEGLREISARAPMLPPEREEHPTSVGQFTIESMLAEGVRRKRGRCSRSLLSARSRHWARIIATR